MTVEQEAALEIAERGINFIKRGETHQALLCLNAAVVLLECSEGAR